MIQTKFNLGENVYFLLGGHRVSQYSIHCGTVSKVHSQKSVISSGIDYDLYKVRPKIGDSDTQHISEECAFSSVEELKEFYKNMVGELEFKHKQE